MSEAKPKKRSWKRRILIASVVLLTLFGSLAFVAPYLLKRYVENHSEEWIGRKHTMGCINFNPFTFGLAETTCTNR